MDLMIEAPNKPVAPTGTNRCCQRAFVVLRWLVLAARRQCSAMKIMRSTVIISLIVICGGCQLAQNDLAKFSEAVNPLEQQYQIWLSEKPRKIGAMQLSGDQLPQNIRQLGCEDVIVSGDAVLFFTKGTSGIVVFTGTNKDTSGLALLGINCTATEQSNIMRFTVASEHGEAATAREKASINAKQGAAPIPSVPTGPSEGAR